MKKKRRRLQSDALWAAGAALLILLQFWWLPGSPGSTVDSWSSGSDGKLGLYRALSRLFPRVEREKALPIPDANCTLLIIGPDRLPTAAEQKQLEAFVNGGGTLLFAPSFAEPEVQLPQLSIKLEPLTPLEAFGNPAQQNPPNTGTQPPRAVSSAPADNSSSDSTSTEPQPASPTDASTGDSEPTVSSPPATIPATTPATTPDELSISSDRTILCESPLCEGTVEVVVASRFSYQPSGSQVLATSGGAVTAAAWELGLGQVIVCTSPDFFSNRSLLMPSAGRLAMRLSAWGAIQPTESQLEGYATFDSSRIVISEYFNTTDSMMGAGVLFNSGLRAGTLQLILTAALGLWLAFHRFGPAEQDVRMQRRSLTDTAHAVGNLQYRSGDGGSLIASQLDYLRCQLRRRFGSAVSPGNRGSLARLSGLPAEEIDSRLTLAERQSAQPRLPVSEAATTIRWLSRLQLALLGSVPGRRQRGGGASE